MSISPSRLVYFVTLATLAALATVAGVATNGSAARADAPAPMPTLDPKAPVLCVDDPRGVPVRLQCDTLATGVGTCWVAPACAQGMEGVTSATCQTIDRARYCDYAADRTYADITADHRVVPARADVERGFYRDVDGRVFQIGFDLNERFWLGARWLGTWSGREGGGHDLDGVGFDLGLRADVLTDNGQTKTRYRFLETDLTLSPFTVRASFLRFDTSNDGGEPFMRVTTFVGEPARHDVYLTAGWWGDLLAVEHRPRASEDDTFLRIVAAGVTWDLWHDADMTSYLRLRGGAALDDLFHAGEDSRIAVTPLAYLEGDFTLDDRGFHHLTLSSGYEAVYSDPDGSGHLVGAKRFVNEVAYELVLVAINDQPLTLRAAVSGGYRDDVADPQKTGWELAATAGLRFSLWAPPRDLDARDEALERRKERGQ